MRWQEISNKKKSCQGCFIETIPENYDAIEIIYTYFTYFFDGMGSISMSNVKEILMKEGQYNYKMFRKVLYFLFEYLKSKQES